MGDRFFAPFCGGRYLSQRNAEYRAKVEAMEAKRETESELDRYKAAWREQNEKITARNAEIERWRNNVATKDAELARLREENQSIQDGVQKVIQAVTERDRRIANDLERSNV